jgi:hypothetical protein
MVVTGKAEGLGLYDGFTDEQFGKTEGEYRRRLITHVVTARAK